MPAEIILAPPTPAITSWTLDDIRMAIDLHEQGDFSLSAPLAVSMGRDDRIFPTLRTRVNALAAVNGGLPFSMEPNERDANAAIAERIAEDVFAEWWDLIPESALVPTLIALILFGVAPGQMIREKNEAGDWYDRVEPLPVHALHWDEPQRRWMYQVRDGVQIEVTPGVDGWVLLQADENEPWFCGAIRALGAPFFFKAMTARDWSRYCERHGLPIITVKEPPVTNPAVKTNFYQGLRAMGSSGIIRLPTNEKGVGYEVALLEATGNSHQAFESFLDRLDRAITIVLLGQDGTTQQSQSSGYAQSKVHNQVRGDYLAADAQILSTGLREQVIKPWGAFYVSNWREALAPWPVWETGEEEDQKARAETWKAVADAIKSLGDTGIPIDRLAIAEAFGIPTLEGAEVSDVGQLFEYHFKYGVITINEVRERLGLERIEDGDELIGAAPEPAPTDTQNPAGAPDASLPPGQAPPPGLPPGPNPPPQLPPAGGTTTTSLATVTQGLVNGQTYIDRSAEASRRRAEVVLAPDVRAILSAIEGAESYDEIRARIVTAFGEMSPKRLADMTAKAIVLSDLAGRYAVLEDL